MSFLSRILKKQYSGFDSKSKRSIAIIGLDGAGKTTIINRLLKSEFNLVRPTFGINIEIYKYGSLEFIVYDIGGQTPLRESLWNKFVASADGIVFVFDSADKKRFKLAVQEFYNTLTYNKKAPLLFLANKIDLKEAVDFNKIRSLFNFNKLIREQRKCEFTQCSALTGEQLFESWDWLTHQLLSKKEIASMNVKILGGYLYLSSGDKLEEFLCGTPKTQSKHFPLLKEGNYEIQRFIKQMKNYQKAETLLQTGNKQLIIVKEDELILGLIIQSDDPAARAIRILKNLHKKVAKKLANKEKINFQEFIQSDYPIDIYLEE